MAQGPKNRDELHSSYSNRIYSPSSDVHTYGKLNQTPTVDNGLDQSYNVSSSTSFPFHSQYARSSYPTFLSLPETATLQSSWAWRGLVDAFRWDVVLSTVLSDAEIRANVLKSLMLNTLSLTSIYVFDLLLQPLVRDQQKWLHRNLGWFYQVLWLFPVVGTSLYLNSSWCTVVANRVYALRHGARKAPPSTYTGILTALATSAYRAVMICTSIVIAFALGYVPVIGNALGLAFFCWVDAYYCFEFIWIARGLSLSQRIRHLEERWAYYFAFGLPSSALCMWGSSLANAAIFALVLPSYIIMAMHARPVPSNPYNPNPHSSTAVTSSPHDFNNSQVRYPSPFIPIRLPVFAIVLWINDRVVRLLSVGSSGSRHRPSSYYTRGSATSSNSMIPLSSFGDGGGRKRGMGISDDTAESIEEGAGPGSGAEVIHLRREGARFGRDSVVTGSLNAAGRRADVSEASKRRKAD